MRFANGAASMPEIGLGDFGPLNVEFSRVRNPFLDLDWDNNSGALGVDYYTEFEVGGDPVPVADADPLTGPFCQRRVSAPGLRGSQHPPSTGRHARKLAAQRLGVTLSDDGSRLVIESQPGRDVIEDFQPLLSQVAYENTSPSPTLGPRTIAFVAYGQDGYSENLKFCYRWDPDTSSTVSAVCGAPGSVDSRQGNEARTTVLVKLGTDTAGDSAERSVEFAVAPASATAGTVEVSAASLPPLQRPKRKSARSLYASLDWLLQPVPPAVKMN